MDRVPWRPYTGDETVQDRVGGTVEVGIPAPLLRMWETRHGLVTPERGPGGQRMYSEGDVELLRAVRMLVGRGYAIGEVANWTHEELLGASREPTAVPRRARARSAVVTPGEQPTVIIVLERDGVVSAVSPNIEALLGWPHALLIGQPISVLMLDIPPALNRLASGSAPPREGTVCWVWLRSRSGEVLPGPARVRQAAARHRGHDLHRHHHAAQR